MTMPFVLSPLWAIASGQIEKIQNVYDRRLDFYATGKHLDKEIKAALEDEIKSESSSNGFEVIDGVGFLRIEGMIIPKSDFFSMFFGGFAAIDTLTRDFTALMDMEDVHTIILDIDSPGGNAFGVQQFANLIFEARSKKNIVAVTSGMMASAAMWIGAAAHKVLITGDVTVTGSIGTVTSHTDISEAHKQMGVKVTEVAAGEFKRIPSSFEPLSEKGRAVLQNQVDHANAAFINDIAKFKGVPKSIVVNKMANRKTFIGTQGIKVGLIDGMINMDTLVSGANDNKGNGLLIKEFNNNFNNLKEVDGMTIKAQIVEMQESNPSLYNAIYEVGKMDAVTANDAEVAKVKTESYDGGFSAGKSEGIIEGKANEQSRIAGLREIATAGNTELINKYIADGTTDAPTAAVAILKLQQTSNAAELAKIKTESPDPLDTNIGTQEETDQSKKGQKQLVAEYMAEHKCSKGVAITACARAYPDAVNDFALKTVKK